MTHGFKPVTTGEAIQVAILDELQQIRGLLEPSQPAPEPTLEPEPEKAADAPAAEPGEKPATKKAPAKKATTRKRVTGQ